MAISQHSREVLERPLDRQRVKSRQGGGNMTFDYIPTDYAIQLLNEAFDYSWDSRVFHHENLGDAVIVGVELKVWDENGNPIVKQQFGSCNINRGVDVGAAFKGASSDGLKKCASQLGLALELYRDDLPAPGFTPPQRSAPQRGAPAAPSAPLPPARPARPPQPAAPAAPPKPPARPAAPAAPVAPPAPPARPQSFGGNTGTASVPRPATPPAPPAPPAPPKAAAAVRPNPFAAGATEKGINSTQMAALNSLSGKKGLSQPDLIALAQIADAQGTPKQTFEELTHSEAIQVIKAAQK